MHSHNRAQPDTFYSRIFARAYDAVTGAFEDRLLTQKRRELLAGVRGAVLEVGAGAGANFALYPPEARVLAIEPSAAMLAHARQRSREPGLRAQLQLLHAGIGDEEVAQCVPEGGFEAVVFTLVLCTIPDPEAALDRVRPWLAPGGRLYVLEHILAEQPAPRLLQKVVNPAWKALGEGCHLTRQTDALLKEKGFVAEWEEYFSKALPFYRAVMRVNTSKL